MKEIQDAEKIVKSIGIPSQPTVILSIQSEMSKPNPNMSLIGKLVTEDVGLSANVIRIASSPFVGMGKVTSIDRALNLLGLKNFFNLVFASALQESLNVKGVPKKIFEVFWSHSLQIAKATQLVAKRVDKKNMDEAYMTGLFHDCGVPLLIRKFPDYINIVDFTIGTTSAAINIEESLYKTNHGIVGYLLAKTWKLFPSVCEAVLWHHISDVSSISNKEARVLTACLQLSENLILDETIKFYKSSLKDYEFDTMTSIKYLTKVSYKKLAEELSLDKDDINDLKEDLSPIIGK
ncbi:MAG TPA: HDOD domain-containing protein [Nitrospirae bacterium]|nr:HDOD domain-containing protein [Nitrospirota bacterium]